MREEKVIKDMLHLLMFRTRTHLYQKFGLLHREGHKNPALVALWYSESFTAVIKKNKSSSSHESIIVD